jgi:pimeloyl-ACP methyl ester carboxylesterase
MLLLLRNPSLPKKLPKSAEQVICFRLMNSRSVCFALLLFAIRIFAAERTANAVPEKPAAHQLIDMEGWKVQVDERLLSGSSAELGKHTMRILSNRLYDIKFLLPADKVAALQKVTIWLDLTHGKLTSAQYHPSAQWLEENGYSKELAKCVHIPDASNYSNIRHQKIQPWSILHELAHSYHDQTLGFDNPEIRKAWEQFKTKEAYNNVLHRGGGGTRHYAFTDPMEFFAEMTEAYFAENDFYPFNRAELKEAEPEIYALLQKIWEGKEKPAVSKTLPLPGEAFEVSGRTCFVISSSKAPEKEKPWVWYAPTLPGLPGPEEKWMFERFQSNGVAIAGMDAGESYGSPKGTALFDRFYKTMTEERGYSRKPVLLARSRGGLMLYNWAIANPGAVQAIAGIYPVCNLASYPGLDKAAPAYEMSAEELRRDLSKYNPADRAQILAERKIPVFHIHGDMDTVVPFEENTGRVEKAYHEGKGPFEALVAKGQGHNMWEGFFQCQQLVEIVVKEALAASSHAAAVP